MPLVSSLCDKDPFEKVHIDCTGPWTACVKYDVTKELSTFKIYILRMVDAATHWTKLALIPTANAHSCAKQFDLCWLCHYPHPHSVGHDNGTEFMEEQFQELLTSYGIKARLKTVKKSNGTVND